MKIELSVLRAYLHKNLKDVDRTFQLGHYYRKSSIDKKQAKDLLNEHIWKLKKSSEYTEPLAKALILIIEKQFPLLLTANAIIPIPNYIEDKERKNSQALAYELSNRLQKKGYHIPVIECLIKLKAIKVQNLKQSEREFAVNGMFKFREKESIKDKNVILLDDVLTAGNVKGRCASILKEHKANNVWILILGRTI